MSKFNDIYLKGKDIIDIIYPIGCVYFSFNATNPSTLFEGTEWEQIKGKVLVGVDEEDTDFNQSGKEDGEKAVSLTVDNIPYTFWHTFDDNKNSISTLFSPGNMYGINTQPDNRTSYVPHNNMPPYVTVYMWKRIS